MLGYLTRLPVLGTAIILLAAALIITPFLRRGNSGDADGANGVVSRTAFYAPNDGPGDGSSAPDATKPQLADLVVEKNQLYLESVTYRVAAEDAKLLQELLEKRIGRPDLLEIRIEGADTLSVIASPRTQEVVEKWVGLLKLAAKPKTEKQVAIDGASNGTR